MFKTSISGLLPRSVVRLAMNSTAWHAVFTAVNGNENAAYNPPDDLCGTVVTLFFAAVVLYTRVGEELPSL